MGTLFFLLFLKINQHSIANVNMKDAAYEKTWIDGGVFARRYRSRSLFRGVFGYGWCTWFDARLEKDENGELVAQICGLTHSTPVQIMSGQVAHKTSDGIRRVFDLMGRLTLVEVPGGLRLQLTYLGGVLFQVKTRDSVWKVKFDQSGQFIVELRSESNKVLTYSYQSHDLTLVTEDSNPLNRYGYDEVHNLIRVESGKTTESVTYDPLHDRVVEYRGDNGCVEQFEYSQLTLKSGWRESAKALVTCQNRKREVRHDFFYEMNSAGEAWLSLVKSKVGSRQKQMRFESTKTKVDRGPPTRRLDESS